MMPKIEKSFSIAESLQMLVPLFLGGVGFLVVLFVIYPKAKDILIAKERLTLVEQELNERVIPKRTFLQSLSEDHENLASDLKELETLVPNEIQPPLILASIEAAAQKEQVAIGSLQYYLTQTQDVTSKEEDEKGEKKVDPKAEQTFIQLNFLAEGNLDHLIVFIQTLQRLAPLNLIENLSIEQGETEEINSASLSTRWFYKPLPKDLGDVEEPISALTAEERKAITQIAQFQSLVLMEEDKKPQGEEIQTPVGKSNPF